MDIGRQIKTARKEKGITQKELSKKICEMGGNMTQRHLSLIENGKTIPLASTIAVIAKALNKALKIK